MDRDDARIRALASRSNGFYARDERDVIMLVRAWNTSASIPHPASGWINNRKIPRDFAFLSRTASLESRLSFTEYENLPHTKSLPPLPSERRLSKPEDILNVSPSAILSTHPLPRPFPPISVINPVSDVINVRCLMIVILNVRTTKKFYRVRYWRADFVFSHVGSVACTRLAIGARAFCLSSYTNAFARIVRSRDSSEEVEKNVPASPDIPIERGEIARGTREEHRV